MGRCGQHGQWTALAAFHILAVECLQGNTKPLRVSSHFVQGNKPVVDVEGAIFHSLGHDRTGELLKALHKIKPCRLTFLVHGVWKTEQQNIPDKIENRGTDGWIL